MALKGSNKILLVSLFVLCTRLTYICARTTQDSFTRKELSILKFLDSVTSSKLENGEYDWSQVNNILLTFSFQTFFKC